MEPSVPNLTFTDTCGGSVNVVYTSSSNASTNPDDYIITRNWDVEDDCGNRSLFTQTINMLTNNQTIEVSLEACINTSEIALSSLTPSEVGVWDFPDQVSILNGAIQPSSTPVGNYTLTYNSTNNGCTNVKIINLRIHDDCLNVTVNSISDGNENEVTNSDTPISGNLFDNLIDSNSFTHSVLSAGIDSNGDGVLNATALNSEISLTDASGNDIGILIVYTNGTYDFSPFTNFSGQVPTLIYNLVDNNDSTDIWNGSTLDITVISNALPCVIKDEKRVKISKTVTPNMDGFNDYFQVAVIGAENCNLSIHLVVYNRWGSKVYESQDYQNKWDGKSSGMRIGNKEHVPSGTYYYIVEVKGSKLNPIQGYIYIGSK